MSAENLQELLVEDLKDLYDAEKQLVKALPKIAKSCESDQLRQAIEEHLTVTERQAERLEKVFELLGEDAESKPCRGMKGIVEEGDEHVTEHSGDELIDTVIVGGSRKVEHYEIVGYTSAMQMAEAVGNSQVARLLRQTLGEEEKMDKKLEQLGSKMLKAKVKEMGGEEEGRPKRRHA